MRLLSDFYASQLDGRKRFNNAITFTYEFTVKCLTLLLDALHGMPLESLHLVDLLLLLKFLRYEGKSDKSNFEKRLLDSLCEQLISHARDHLSLETKLLICIVCDSFDNFNGRFEKVSFQTKN